MSVFKEMNVTAARARSTLDRYAAEGYASGMVGLIGIGDEAEAIVVGHRGLQSSESVRRDSLFRISSMTKPISALATLMLVGDGSLRLDEPVDAWLPELANRRVLKRMDAALDDTVAARRPITVEDLLTFRHGLGIVLAPPGSYPIQRKIDELKLVGFGPPDPSAALTPDEWIQRLGSLPLMAQPGVRWMYNTGSYVLGVLLARVSGRPLPQLLHERVFEPLGMKDTGFFVPPGKLSRLASLNRPTTGAQTPYDTAAGSRWRTPPAFPDAGAGLVSTVDDYFAFSRLLLGRGRIGGRRLVSEQSIVAMTSDHLTVAQRREGVPILSSGQGWGFGVSVVGRSNAGGLPPHAYGWNGGLGTTWFTDPRTGHTAILLTTTTFASPKPPPVHEEFWRDVFRPANS